MVARRNFSRRKDETLNIPAKANRVLNIVLISMLLILLRIWHLTVVQHDEKVSESKRPQRRVQLEPAKRGTIRDRFNIPMALNKLQYNVSILYSQIRQIPTISWETDSEGVRTKHYKRREYITSLSQLLAETLDMDADRIEDLIHAKAALYNQIPFVLKENIHEEQYYRLRMLEKDWPGIYTERAPRRTYPLGKVGSDIIGYMGAINKQEYEAIIQEMKALRSYLEAINIGDVVMPPAGMTSSEDARRRLSDLEELAYSVNDSIGKGGIEGRYESVLKGFRGKRSYYSDIKGNILMELPGSREPLSGKRILLTISSELQEFAEQLLIENETIRQPVLSPLGTIKRNVAADKEPWIKGGAIVAMDPNTGDIIAMASHPRFDPNDFTAIGQVDEDRKRKRNLLKWLESESYLEAVWDGQQPLDRENYSKVRGIYLEEMSLTWENYLKIILSRESALHRTPLHNATIYDAFVIQKAIDNLLNISSVKSLPHLLSYLYKGDGVEGLGKRLSVDDAEDLEESFSVNQSVIDSLKYILAAYFEPLGSVYDRVLLVDLFRLAVRSDAFSEELLENVGHQTLADYREAEQAMITVHNVVKSMAAEIFHDRDFRKWRNENEKEFLRHVRASEKANNKYAKPYIDYLDAKEKELFNMFWQGYCHDLMIVFLNGMKDSDATSAEMEPYITHLDGWYREIALGAHQHIDWAASYFLLKATIENLPDSLKYEYLQTFRSYNDLQRPLYGSYPSLRRDTDGKQLEKHLAIAFYPKYGYGYGRSQAYRQSATQGSIFKLITAYQALVQAYKKYEEAGLYPTNLNPLEIHDQVVRKGNDLIVGYLSDGTPIPRHYKGGRMPRSLNANIGHLDIIKAIEMSSNPYFSLLAGEYLHSPNDLAMAARSFSYGSRTGIDLPGEIMGNIPQDLDTNRTGVYSFAIGQHTLVVTPLQTSVMLSALVNGGKVLKPKIVNLFIGQDPERSPSLFGDDEGFAYQNQLKLIGIDYPLFLRSEVNKKKSPITRVPTIVKNEIFYPPVIQTTLLDGMCRVVERTQKEGLSGLTRLYRNCPHIMKDYIALKRQLLGKTSTSESVENIDLDKNRGTNIYTHVWFGGISYEEDILNENEHQFLFRDSFGSPELVVVVYLRYGGYGKEAAPVAAQVAKKWKEIKSRK